MNFFFHIKVCFSNPLDRKILVEVNKKKFFINSRGCELINLDETSPSEVIEIKSDFIRARPFIIVDDGTMLDCMHT